jgi:hypothetical protein
MPADKRPDATNRKYRTKGICGTCNGPVHVHDTWEGRFWRHSAGRGRDRHPIVASEVTNIKLPPKDSGPSRIQILRDQGVKSPAEKEALKPKKEQVQKPPRVVNPKHIMVDYFDKKGKKIDPAIAKVRGATVPRGAYSWKHPVTGESGEVSQSERDFTESVAAGTPNLRGFSRDEEPEGHDHPWSPVKVDGNDLVTGPSAPGSSSQFRQLARAWAVNHWHKAKEAGREINTRIQGNNDPYDPNYGNWEVLEQDATCKKCHPDNPNATEKPPVRQNGDVPGHLAKPVTRDSVTPVSGAWLFPSEAPIKEGNKNRYPTPRKTPNWAEIAAEKDF